MAGGFWCVCVFRISNHVSPPLPPCNHPTYRARHAPNHRHRHTHTHTHTHCPHHLSFYIPSHGTSCHVFWFRTYSTCGHVTSKIINTGFYANKINPRTRIRFSLINLNLLISYAYIVFQYRPLSLSTVHTHMLTKFIFPTFFGRTSINSVLDRTYTPQIHLMSHLNWKYLDILCWSKIFG